MSIPNFQTLMLPILKEANSGEIRLAELTQRLARQFNLTEEDRNQLLPSGRQTTFANRTGWAKTFLAKAGLIKTPRRGYVEITDRGRKILVENPDRIDVNFLSQFPEFEEFRTSARRGSESSESAITDILDKSGETPDELLRTTHKQLENALRSELLSRLLEGSPTFFETTIVNLLLSMGYGGAREDAGRAIGRAGDHGLDGVIDQDALGLDRVYIQAKRYGFEHAVGEPEIRAFAGSLEGVKATKGVFVTTSYFTQEARSFTTKVSRIIVLVDGEELARLMLRHNVGVRIEETLYIKKIDEDFFSPE